MATIVLTKVITQYDPDAEEQFTTTWLGFDKDDQTVLFSGDVSYGVGHDFVDAWYATPTSVTNELDGLPE